MEETKMVYMKVACRAASVLILVLLTTLGISLPAGAAPATKDEALKILKAMSDYVAGQKTIAATFDADIEVITPEVEKIQFNNSGKMLLVRPDKFRATRVGGYADVELIADGQTVTVHGKNINSYAQIKAPGTTDQMFDKLRGDLGMQMPGTDLLLSNVFDVLTKDVIDAKYIGAGVIGGVECEHLAFRNEDTDWQLWVQTGPQPIPRKLVITTKTVAGAPQYTLVIRDWQTDQPPAPDAFVFKAPDGAKQVNVEELSDIDELPAGTAIKGDK